MLPARKQLACSARTRENDYIIAYWLSNAIIDGILTTPVRVMAIIAGARIRCANTKLEDEAFNRSLGLEDPAA